MLSHNTTRTDLTRMMASAEYNWSDLKWLEGARRLLKWLNTVKEDLPVLLLIRHSHRTAITSLDEMRATGITDMGRAAAQEFGRRLPNTRQLELYHSFVSRCKETAESIAEGFRTIGGTVRNIVSTDLLVGPNVTDERIWDHLGTDGDNVVSFVNMWHQSKFTPEQMETRDSFSRRISEVIIQGLKRATRGTLQIYVTHDVFLISTRSVLVTDYLVPGARPTYLGGYGLVFDNNRLLLFDGEQIIETVVDPPE